MVCTAIGCQHRTMYAWNLLFDKAENWICRQLYSACDGIFSWRQKTFMGNAFGKPGAMRGVRMAFTSKEGKPAKHTAISSGLMDWVYCRMRKRMKASLTVEMTLLFPILLMMVLLMMGLSIYVYDRCVIKQCVYDALLQGSREEYDTRQQKKQAMQEKLEESLEDYAICPEGTQIVYEADLQKVRIRVNTATNLLWLRSVELPITVEEELRCFHTVKLMRLHAIGKEIISNQDEYVE